MTNTIHPGNSSENDFFQKSIFFPVKFLVNSNIFIAICAVAATFQTHLMVDVPLRIDPLIIVVFCASFLVYNLFRLISLPNTSIDSESAMHDWMRHNKFLLYGMMLMAVIICTIFILKLDTTTLLFLVFTGVISFFYAFPFIVIKSVKIRLRDFGIFKPFIVGVIWAVATVILPIVNAKVEPNNETILLLSIERFLFISALTIPFDIRDMSYDLQLKFKTIPIKWGIGVTKVASITVLILFAFVAGMQVLINVPSPTKLLIAFLVTTFISIIIISRVSTHRSEYYYTFLLDVLIVLQLLLIGLALTI